MKVLIACFPKSGSTYLTNLISEINEFKIASWLPAHGHREQEIEEQLIIANDTTPHQVAQHHVRASSYTLELIERHEIIPIILVRNIFDCMVSLADHTKNEAAVYPMGFIEERLRNESFEERLDAIVDLVSPWYINFYASWYHARPMNIVRYEDIILGDNDKRIKILSDLRIKVNNLELLSSTKNISGETTRFNVGISGRGEENLSNAQINKIKNLTKHYKNVDFSKIGI